MGPCDGFSIWTHSQTVEFLEKYNILDFWKFAVLERPPVHYILILVSLRKPNYGSYKTCWHPILPSYFYFPFTLHSLSFWPRSPFSYSSAFPTFCKTSKHAPHFSQGALWSFLMGLPIELTSAPHSCHKKKAYWGVPRSVFLGRFCETEICSSCIFPPIYLMIAFRSKSGYYSKC